MTSGAERAAMDGTAVPGGTDELEFRTHKEEPVRFAARFGADRPVPGREPLLARKVVLASGWSVLQYRLPLSAQGNASAYAALEREVSAAVAVERRFESDRYVELFTRVIGFDLEAAEPFVLYRVPDGAPVAGRQGALTVEEQHQVLTQLTLAVRLLEDLGLVHRAITPHSVRWDGTHIRLAEPGHALRTGEPREAFGAAPWSAPEQRSGTGVADPRDDLWSVAQLMYFLLAGRPGPADGPPPDLPEFRRLAALEGSGAFAPLAAARPAPAELMRLLNAPDPLLSAPPGADPLARSRGEYDSQIAVKRGRLGLDGVRQGEPEEPVRSRRGLRSLFGSGTAVDSAGAPADTTARPAPRPTLCPHCLLPIAYDESRLFTPNAKNELKPLDLSGERRPMHRQDALRKAVQQCPYGQGVDEHYLPVPYLTNGEPLTIAMVGSSTVGKTHLLAAILGEIEQGGLEPYGLKCLPLSPGDHRRFLRDQVQPLRQGQVLKPTVETQFARFADGLLVSGHGRTRPVLFFDLAGEDLTRHDDVTTFLMGMGAFIFVLDPLRSLQLPRLAPLRERWDVTLRDLGDEAFNTVLGRIPRTGRYVDAAAAIALNKSDLVRFDPSVDRWLGRALPPRIDAGALRAESRDAYAFVRHYGSQAWLRPFDDCSRCTLHFVAATGGQAKGDVYPHGVRPRRVLAPLLSIFAMAGLLPGVDLGEVGL
ncbi:hypothetical protein ACFQVC_00970 [Streptomyces monticola]|uniref:Protein kinase domain-containing protein n=1 Tax=Streptomyces monticola TaxID=2666263 RepID=A0ABW2JA03_9ACTN